MSAIRGNGQPHPRAADVDGVALRHARRRKERTYPELSGDRGRARLVVLALETGGRWSSEAWQFVRQVAEARARSEPELLRRAAQAAWHRRFVNLLAVAAQRAFAESLLEMTGGRGADGDTIGAQEVLEDARYGW